MTVVRSYRLIGLLAVGAIAACSSVLKEITSTVTGCPITMVDVFDHSNGSWTNTSVSLTNYWKARCGEVVYQCSEDWLSLSREANAQPDETVPHRASHTQCKPISARDRVIRGIRSRLRDVR